MTIIRVIDFETTGDKPPAEVCEVGMCDLLLEEKRISDPISWLCRVNEMPPEVRAVHHITMADCEPWCPFEQTALLAGQPNAFAAHNANFEMQFFVPVKPMICTYKSALRAWPDAPSHSNGALRYWLQDQGLIVPNHVATQPTHRAGPDAYVTAHILLALFNAGHTGAQMVEWTKEPPMLPKCPLGKFRGKPWPEVDGGFLGWMLRQPDMDEGLKWNAEREIARRQENANV